MLLAAPHSFDAPAMLYAVSRLNTALEGRYAIEGASMATADHAHDLLHERRITHLTRMSADHA